MGWVIIELRSYGTGREENWRCNVGRKDQIRMILNRVMKEPTRGSR